MTEQRNLARFATISNAAFNSISANATAILSMSVGGHTINATSFAGTANNANNLGGVAAASYALLAGPTFTGNTTAANLALTGLRITGDFSNATPANRLAFQTSATNAGTGLYVLPNGTSTTSAIQLFANSNPSNTSMAALIASSTEVQVLSTRTGTGDLLPLTFAAGGSERMRIDTAGNIGVGTTPNINTTSRIFVSGDITRVGATGGFLFNAQYSTTNLRWEYAGSGTAAGWVDVGSGNYAFLSTGSTTGTSGTTASFVERMRITSTGSVGIGETSPTVRLEVNSGGIDEIARFGGSTVVNPYVSLFRQGTRMGFWYAPGGSYVEFAAEGRPLYLTTSAAHDMLFLTNSVERMRISSGGNVAIGTTSTTTARLNVSLNNTSYNDGIFVVNGATGTGAQARIGVQAGAKYAAIIMDESTSDLYFYNFANGAAIFSTNNVERMRITANGHCVPSATNTYDLGSSSLRWRNIFTQDLHLSNGIGDYTVIEGEENLYLVNNKSNKSFKFALIEVDPSEVPPKSVS